MTLRRCFKTGGGFAVWVDDEETPEAPAAPAITEAPAAPVATDEDEDVPPEGDCDGCAKKPSAQPPKAT